MQCSPIHEIMGLLEMGGGGGELNREVRGGLFIQTLLTYSLSVKTSQLYVLFSSLYKNTPTGDEVGSSIEIRRDQLQNLMSPKGGEGGH